jgi:hypothetical protein
MPTEPGWQTATGAAIRTSLMLRAAFKPPVRRIEGSGHAIPEA